MTSLRRRFVIATGALLVAQIATSGLALATWRRAIASTDRQQALAEARVEVAGLGAAVREQYVHQAHTYIEGGPGHLHHGAAVATAVRDRLDRLDQMDLSPDEHATLADIRADQHQLEAWFDERVAPLALENRLDRATATQLHAGTESLTKETTGRIDALLGDLDAANAVEQQHAARATNVAVGATLALVAIGLGVVLFIGRSLATAVLVPVEAIRTAAAAWRPGSRPESADEIGEIAYAFDAIVVQLGQAEERRLESARLAALGEMSAAVAHELLNPLTVILGHAALLDDPAAAPIRAEAEHARRIVKGLLGFARPIEQPASHVDLDQAVRDAVDRFTFAADGAGVSLIADSRAANIDASPSGVRQILDNLVRNAIEASTDGDEVRVAILTEPLRVEVRDHGAGIPAAVRARLYEPFVTGRSQGTGLGLAVSRRIARSLGGDLTHRDGPGGGTIAVWTVGAGEAHRA